jgi:hypothetical protein
MSTNKNDYQPIPEWFEHWILSNAETDNDGYAIKWAAGATAAYRKLSQRAAPHPEDVKEVEKTIMAALNEHLRIRGVGGDYISGKKEVSKYLAVWMTGFWGAMDEGAEQWKADYENLKVSHESLLETLKQRLDKIRVLVEALSGRAAPGMPDWISADVLPPDQKSILGTDGKMVYVCNYYRDHQQDVDCEDDDPGEDIESDEKNGCYWLKPGYYETIEQHGGYYDEISVRRNITHWMPMPPKPGSAPSAASGAPEEKKAMVKAIWMAIEHFQDAFKEDDSPISYSELESELYDVMEKIDPSKPKPSPNQGEAPEALPVDSKEVPGEIKDWIDDRSECDSDDDCTLWRNGAIAMYWKMMAGEGTKANTRYSDTVLDLRAAEKERQRQQSLKNSCLATIEDQKKKYAKLEASLAEARKEKQDIISELARVTTERNIAQLELAKALKTDNL